MRAFIQPSLLFLFSGRVRYVLGHCCLQFLDTSRPLNSKSDLIDQILSHKKIELEKKMSLKIKYSQLSLVDDRIGHFAFLLMYFFKLMKLDSTSIVP